MLRTKCVAAFILLLVPGVNAADLREKIDRLAQPYLDSQTVVGMSVGIIKDGETVVRGYGRLSDENSQTPDEKTLYEIGSVTKVFTALLLADAVVERRVSLVTPVEELLPKSVTMLRRDNALPIRLWHLATHTSGLPLVPDNIDPSNPDDPYAEYGGRQLADFLRTYKPTKKPGEEIAYSNTGVDLLGTVLAYSQKRSYEDLIKDRIAGPLSLGNTMVTLDAERRARLAPPHHKGGASSHTWTQNKLPGAGALHSNVSDLLKFMQAQLDPPNGKLGQAIELAWQVHQKPIERGDPSLGLGWHVHGDGSTRWHNGETGGYHATVFLNRQLNAGAVVLTNTATSEVDQLAAQLLRAAVGAAEKPRVFEKGFKVSPEVINRYLGKYRFVPGVDIEVTTKKDQLFIRLTGQQELRVQPRTKTEWLQKDVDATIKFTVDDSGRCTALELFQNGVRQTARRLENGEPIEVEQGIKVSTKVMRRYVGKYQLAPGAVFTVSVKKRQLYVRLTGQPALRVYPRSDTEWFPQEIEATITFEVDPSGRCTALELFQGGVRQQAERVE